MAENYELMEILKSISRHLEDISISQRKLAGREQYAQPVKVPDDKMTEVEWDKFIDDNNRPVNNGQYPPFAPTDDPL